MGNPIFTTDNAAIVLIDHQDMTVGWIRSQPQSTTINNVRMLARVGAELGVPHMVTSTMEDIIGTNIKDVQELAPEAYAARVKRGGTLNAFLDPAFVDAVKGLGRSNLILAGLTTDICLFHTARGAIDAGYEVQVVADACGSSSVSSDELTFDRLRALGATITGGNQVLSELFTDFGTEQGQKAQQINMDEIIAKMAVTGALGPVTTFRPRETSPSSSPARRRCFAGRSHRAQLPAGHRDR